MARRADHARRDHAVAEVVSFPHHQDLLLGAHRAGAIAGAAGAQTPGQESAWRAYRRVIRRAARSGARLAERRAPDLGLDQVLWCGRRGDQTGRTAVSADDSPSRDRGRCRLRRRAPQRRRRRRRHLPGHGEYRADVRRAGLCRRSSVCRHSAGIDRAPARRQTGRGLLPALRFAGLGHGPDGACIARGRRRGMRSKGARRPCLA